MKFKVGDKVEHEEYGIGIIKGIDRFDDTYAVEFLNKTRKCAYL